MMWTHVDPAPFFSNHPAGWSSPSPFSPVDTLSLHFHFHRFRKNTHGVYGSSCFGHWNKDTRGDSRIGLVELEPSPYPYTTKFQVENHRSTKSHPTHLIFVHEWLGYEIGLLSLWPNLEKLRYKCLFFERPSQLITLWRLNPFHGGIIYRFSTTAVVGSIVHLLLQFESFIL